MTKSLSQELCELCGIRTTREILWVGGARSIITRCPDFTEPSNLIKLMDLKYAPCQSLMLLITLHNVGIRSTIDFLEQLIDFLRADGVFISNIKQAIRDTEWRY